jgi:hypothetical protein
VNARDGSGLTPLHGAVRSVALTRLYLDRGADPEAVDSWGRTPLRCALDVLQVYPPIALFQPERQRLRDVMDILEAAMAATAAP